MSQMLCHFSSKVFTTKATSRGKAVGIVCCHNWPDQKGRPNPVTPETIIIKMKIKHGPFRKPQRYEILCQARKVVN